ncbi:MAG: OmpA family protein [Halomonas sp.]|uniref:OmpA family protein n=1 Tax=Halomonas sp. TaxID=1486246 RepID=UPI003F8FE602
MKKSTTGLLIGSALVVGLTGCASSASQSSSAADSSSSARSWYQHPVVCGVAGGLIGGGIGYATSSSSDEESGGAIGATAGAAIGALLCAEPKKAAPAPEYKDSDGDGVPDNIDQCPGTPAGVAVDAVGCPLDSDGDGVPDYQDQCPGTPAGATVNALGCVDNMVLRDVNFEFDSARLTPHAQQILLGVAEKLRANPNVRIRIEGHTDSVGNAAYNKQLSKARADSVAAFLASQGVSGQRMTTVGYGEERPIASNETNEGRALNRRVEMGEWE